MMTSRFTSGTARSAPEIEALRDVWHRWQTHPDNDIDNFLLRLKSRKEVIHPYVVQFSKGDEPALLVLSRLEKDRVDFKVGYKTIRGPVLTSLAVPYGGVLGKIDEEAVPMILEVLLGEMRRENADKITFHCLPEGSPMLRAVQSTSGALFRVVQEEWTHHWKTTLPSDIETFWAKLSRRHRMFLRRMAKRLESDFAGQIGYSSVTEEADVERLCEQIEKVAKKTYLRGLGKGFIWDREHYERLTMSARNHRLRAFLLHVAGEVRSYAVGSVYGGSYALAYTAYDPEFNDYDVGQLVLVNAIESLCREGVQQFDFGFGTALYKERFGDTCVRERSVSLYAPTVKAATLVAAQKTTLSATRVARAFLEKVGVAKLLKRYWRKRLAQNQNAKAATKANGSDTHD